MRHARQLTLAGQSLEAQQLLLDLAKSSDPAIRREAVVLIAVQLHKAGLDSLAAEYDAELAGPLADQVLFDDMTGRELVAKWREGHGEDPRHWPRGRVKNGMMPATPSMGAISAGSAFALIGWPGGPVPSLVVTPASAGAGVLATPLQ